jgi:phosphoadenosine phosphosulfate reductase
VGAIVLGKIHLRWCHTCDVLVLEQGACSVCGSKTATVKLTPPGDARPAFPKDIKRIRALIDEQFGHGLGKLVIPDRRIVLLNKAPDIDRMDEIILGGEVVGAVRYVIRTGERFMLRPASATVIAPSVKRNWVKVDEGAVGAIQEKSASTLAVGVVDCDRGIEPGAEVIVLGPGGEPVSVGVSKMSSKDMLGHNRGTAVKTRWKVEPGSALSPGKEATWDQVLEANKEVLSRRTSDATQFIKKVTSENDLPVAVSYSGGKDSLATLLLVLDAGIKPNLLFVDTGLEFEETRKNVKKTAARYDLKLIVESAGDSFWKNLEHFGPPAKDFRWCCKTCKLGPATQLIQRNFPEGVLSFIGQRAYESQQRAEKARVWRNPWTPNQLAASPIQKWTALHVWLYLLSKAADVNPLYEDGLERIGCFMCPATDLAELARVREMAPEYDRWQKYLDSYAERTGRAGPWHDYDLWRWRRIPKSVLDELTDEERRIASETIAGPSEGELEFRSTSGYSPCVEGLSMEGIFTRALPMERVANLLNVLGEVTTSPDGNIAEVKSITVFREGPVMVKAKDEKELREKSAKLRELVFRAVNCAGCGICMARCVRGAMSLNGQVVIDASKCVHCGECLGPCPAVKFREEELDI